MSDVPVVIPVTTPVADPIVPTARLVEVQRPPGVGSVNAVVAPIQTLSVPPIAPGDELTVTVFVT